MSGFMGLRRPIVPLTTAEKNLFWVKLSADGTPGHGSIPLKDNCVERLVKAVERVVSWQRPFTLTPETASFLAALAHQGLIPEAGASGDLSAIAGRDPVLATQLRDSISLTGFSAGYKHNVIPSHAEATLDIRLLPSTDADEFLRRLREQIGDPEVTIEVVHHEDSPSAPAESELHEVCRQVTREFIEDAEFTLMMCSGGTDSRYFRRRGVVAYGFNPILATDEEIRTLHSHNERISVENLRLGTQIIFEVARRMCV